MALSLKLRHDEIHLLWHAKQCIRHVSRGMDLPEQALSRLLPFFMNFNTDAHVTYVRGDVTVLLLQYCLTGQHHAEGKQ